MVRIRVQLLACILVTQVPCGAQEVDVLSASNVESSDWTRPGQTELELEIHEDWSFVLPELRCHKVESAIVIGDHQFVVVKPGGMRLEIDSDLDGKLDLEVQGRSNVVKLSLSPGWSSQPFDYAVRIECDGADWNWSTAVSMRGEIAGEPVHLFDLNGDGHFDEYGVDGLLIGHGRAGCYLSEVAHLNGKLRALEVLHSGRTVGVENYDGPTAEIDVMSAFACRGKLVSAIVQDNGLSFNLARKEAGWVTLPAGTYELVEGHACGEGEAVIIRPGEMRPMHLQEGDRLRLEWGGPLQANCSFRLDGNRISVLPDVVYRGRAGEEYVSFQPHKNSPTIEILDERDGSTLRKGRFGGCCGGGLSIFRASLPPGAQPLVHLTHSRALFEREIVGTAQPNDVQTDVQAAVRR